MMQTLKASPIPWGCFMVMWILVASRTCGEVFNGWDPSAGFLTVRGKSGQFSVSRPKDPPPVPLGRGRSEYADWIAIRPATLLVTCERLCEAFRGMIDDKEAWQGTIRIYQRPSRSEVQGIGLGAVLHADGWHYRMELGDWAHQDHLLEALTKVILQEKINRYRSSQLVDLPWWLVRGIGRQLHATSPHPIVIQPDSVFIQTGGELLPDPLAQARVFFQDHSPITFAEFSKPLSAGETALGAGPGRGTYSAQLLVARLLELPGGKLKFRTFLGKLPLYLNWELAFLETYREDFASLLDVEKWWSIQSLLMQGRDGFHKWSMQGGLERLDGILHPSLEKTDPETGLKQPAPTPLQVALDLVPYEDHPALLGRLISELELLYAQSPPALMRLVMDYRNLLTAYLESRSSKKQWTGVLGLKSKSNHLEHLHESLRNLEVLRQDLNGYDSETLPASLTLTRP